MLYMVILNFGHCDLFVICDLEFSPKLKRFLFDLSGRSRSETPLNLEPKRFQVHRLSFKVEGLKSYIER